MNDNKIILSLAIAVIALFGLFMLLTGEDEPAVTVSNEALSQNQAVPEMPLEAELITTTEEDAVQNLPVPEVVELIDDEELGQDVISSVEGIESIENSEEAVAGLEAEMQAEPEPVLPMLNGSDDFVIEALATMDGGAPLLSYLVSEELIRKFVIMIENISRGEFPERNLPLLYPEEAMHVSELGSDFYVMDERSYQRFNGLVSALSNISTETAVDLYLQMEPLFQEAYAELGIPSSEFDEVFNLAIERILNARTAPQPQQLIRPNLNYLYADPEIESYSALEKLLLRLGPENTESLQRRLEFFKRRLDFDSALNG